METPVDIVAALEAPVADPASDAKFRALQSLQTRKVRALMGSIRKLENELESVRSAQRPNRQHAMIRQLKNILQEREQVVDLLKSELVSAKEMSEEELNIWIVKRTVGGPKRFRPKTPEELQIEIGTLQKTLRKLERKLSMPAKPKKAVNDAPATRNLEKVVVEKGSDEDRQTGLDENGLPTLTMADIDPADLIRERTDMLQRLEDLRIELRTQEGIADGLSKETRELRAENRDLRRETEVGKRLQGRLEAAKVRLLERDTELERQGKQLMAAEEDLAVAKTEVLEMEAAHQRTVQQIRDELALAAEEMNQMEAREMELENELEQAKILGSTERQATSKILEDTRTMQVSLATRLRQVERERDRLSLFNQRQQERIGDLERAAGNFDLLMGQLRTANQEKRAAFHRLKDLERLYNDSQLTAATQLQESRNLQENAERDAMEKKKEKAEIVGEMRAWRKKATELQERIAQLELDLQAEKQTHDQTAAALEKEQKVLQEARQEAMSDGAEQLATVQSLRDAVDLLEATKKELKEECAALRTQLKDWSKRTSSLERKLREANEKSARMEKKLSVVTEVHEREKQAQEALKAEAEDCRKATILASRENAELRAELLETQKTKSSKDITKSRSQKASLVEELDSLPQGGSSGEANLQKEAEQNDRGRKNVKVASEEKAAPEDCSTPRSSKSSTSVDKTGMQKDTTIETLRTRSAEAVTKADDLQEELRTLKDRKENKGNERKSTLLRKQLSQDESYYALSEEEESVSPNAP